MSMMRWSASAAIKSRFLLTGPQKWFWTESAVCSIPACWNISAKRNPGCGSCIKKRNQAAHGWSDLPPFGQGQRKHREHKHFWNNWMVLFFDCINNEAARYPPSGWSEIGGNGWSLWFFGMMPAGWILQWINILQKIWVKSMLFRTAKNGTDQNDEIIRRQ